MKTLSKNQAKSVAELTDLVATSPVAVWMLSHGMLKESMHFPSLKRVFPALTDDQLKVSLGVCKNALSIAFDRGLFTGEIAGVRAQIGGSTMMSVKTSLIGDILSDAMLASIAEAKSRINKGELPTNLLLPASSQDAKKEVAFTVPGMEGIWKWNFRLTLAALDLTQAKGADLNDLMMSRLAAEKIKNAAPESDSEAGATAKAVGDTEVAPQLAEPPAEINVIDAPSNPAPATEQVKGRGKRKPVVETAPLELAA